MTDHTEHTTPSSRTDDLGLLGLTSVLLRRWRLLVGLPLAAAAIAAGISLLMPSMFAASATFVPEVEATESPVGGIAGLAAQFGVSLQRSGTSDPQFYANVLHSRTVLDRILEGRFPDPRAAASADRAALLDILDVPGETLPERMERGRKLLTNRVVAVRIEEPTNIVSVSVTTRYPALSAEVANQLVSAIGDFNLDTRQSKARLRREFVEGRVQTLEQDLRDAEAALQQFLERNRSYAQSPELTLQYERLQRQVAMKQEVVTSLRRSFEEARLLEVNDTPVITVIDRAIPPTRKSSPNRRLQVILAFALGLVVAVFAALVREFLDRMRRRDAPEYAQLVTQWNFIKTEMRALPRRPAGRDH